MKKFVEILAILLLTAVSTFAAESPGGGGRASSPLRMEELEVRGNAPLRMEELEVLGRRQTPEILYLPVHRGAAFRAPVRYDLFLEDMEKPVFPREIYPQKRPADMDSFKEQ
jgi:hypothetical protein